jgi:tRNA modification GTPase
MTRMSAERTVMACLTPPGKGAIAVVAVRGPAAWPATRALFQRFTARAKGAAATAPLPETPVPGRFCLGQFGADSRDEAVLFVRDAESGGIEIHCHGGSEVVRLVQAQYRQHGIIAVPWADYEGGQLPDWQAKAASILARAPTVRTASIALDQWHGAFQRRVQEIEALLAQGQRDAAAPLISRLVELIPVGRHLIEPWRVVVAGAPNVGKSSLINAIAGFTRCLVSPTPGTTRDVVTTTVAFDGWPVELCDTAGLRDGAEEAEELEDAGIARARQAAAAADLGVWVLDGAAAPVFPERRAGWLFVVNKSDLPAAWDVGMVPGAIAVSALTRTGLSQLIDAIVRRLVPHPPSPGEAVPISDEDVACVVTLHAGTV